MTAKADLGTVIAMRKMFQRGLGPRVYSNLRRRKSAVAVSVLARSCGASVPAVSYWLRVFTAHGKVEHVNGGWRIRR